VDRRVVAVVERVPAQVVGAGAKSVAALIADLNNDSRIGAGHRAVVTRIVADVALEAGLPSAGVTLAAMPTSR
jgi:cyanophycin synthetase